MEEPTALQSDRCKLEADEEADLDLQASEHGRRACNKAQAAGESVFGSVGTATGRQQHCACGAASGAEGQSSCVVRDSLSINDYDLPVESPAETGTLSREAQSTANETGVSSKDQSMKPISLKLLSEGGYYDMPMSGRSSLQLKQSSQPLLQKAAHLLGRTEGSFQRVCRGLGILRWPYRVRKSLQAIMSKTEQYLDDNTEQDGMSKAEVLKVLQAHMDDIKGISGAGMDKATKQYRQYIFKLNHKLAKKTAKQGTVDPESGLVKFKGMLRAAAKISKSGSGGLRREASLATSEPASEPAISDSPPQETQATADGNATADGDAAAGGSGQRSGSSNGSPTLMQPTPRRFCDLPATLAFQPLGPGKRTSNDIVGHLATGAAIQSRLRDTSQRHNERLQDDQQLLRLCIEMDAHLQAAQDALMLCGPPPPVQLPPLASTGASLHLQQILGASLGYSQPAMFAPATARIGEPLRLWQS